MKIKVRDVRPIIIREKETKEEITRTWSAQQAKDIIKEFEKEDKKDGTYVKDSYEVYNTRTDKIVE